MVKVIDGEGGEEAGEEEGKRRGRGVLRGRMGLKLTGGGLGQWRGTEVVGRG